MKNIFSRLFRKKGPIQPRPSETLYGPPAILYGPPEVFNSSNAPDYTPRPVSHFMEQIPGKLTVLTGPDKEKSFPMTGLKTNFGITVTVGRYTESWYIYMTPNQQTSHILIDDPSDTFSRMQFEITYKPGEIYLKSLSEKNETIVDGEIVQHNHRVKIRSGSLITAGHVELRYEV